MSKSHYYWIKEHYIAPEHSGFSFVTLEIEEAGYKESSWKDKKKPQTTRKQTLKCSYLDETFPSLLEMSYVPITGQKEEKIVK